MDRPKQPINESDKEHIAPAEVWIFDRSGPRARLSQWVVRERPVTLYFNGEEMLTILCAGHHLEELAVGFFCAEGFIESHDDLQRIDVDHDTGNVHVVTRHDPAVVRRLWGKRTVTSGCGKGTVFYNALDALLSQPVASDLRLPPQAVLNRMKDLNQLSKTYRRTHGVHNTALATPSQLVLFRDDIGRHNAVDMIVGHAFLNHLPLHDKMLITTGRLTSEILIKAAKVGIPVLVSRNTASTLAIELAHSLNITLIGYVRAGKFTVYAGSDRLATLPAEASKP